MDESTRRMLRFSLFLQGAAMGMFVIVVIVQLVTGTTSVFTLFFLIAIVALVWGFIRTRRMVRQP